jgi:UDP-2,3-diacylglucosamine hydrolase
VHSLNVDGRDCTRIVLGDWHEQGSLLRWGRAGPQLLGLPR